MAASSCNCCSTSAQGMQQMVQVQTQAPRPMSLNRSLSPYQWEPSILSKASAQKGLVLWQAHAGCLKGAELLAHCKQDIDPSRIWPKSVG